MDSIILNDRYKLDSVIGEGGMATTYRGEDLLLSRVVAIKIMREQYVHNVEFVERFRHEAQAAARVQNENIAGVYDTGFDNGSYYLVMEYVEGTDLKQRMRMNPCPMPLLNALSLSEQIASGLAVAHKARLVHRDIKPHNILINNEGKVKITDFGIARIDSDTEDTGIIVGSVHYISPEQVKGESATEAADIYSLGAVMYEMLTGKTLFDGETAMAIAQKQVNEVPIPIINLNPAVPKEVEELVNRALEKEPRFRYQSAGEFAAAIRRAIVKLSAENTIIINKKEEHLDHTMIIERPPAAPATRKAPAKKEKEEEERKDNNGGVIAIIVITLLLIAGIIIYLLMFSKAGHVDNGDGENTANVVPDVVGKKFTDAEQSLTDLGLIIITEEEFSEDKSVGTILSQIPKAGIKFTEGSVIKLSISKGPELFSLPDVVGLSPEAAKKRLEEAGFSFKYTTKKEQTNSVEPGKVFRTEPPSGSSIQKQGGDMTIFIGESIPEVNATFKTTAPIFGQAEEEYYITIELIRDDDSIRILRDRVPVTAGESINETFKKREDENVMIRIKAGTTKDTVNEVIEETNIT